MLENKTGFDVKCEETEKGNVSNKNRGYKKAKIADHFGKVVLLD